MKPLFLLLCMATAFSFNSCKKTVAGSAYTKEFCGKQPFHHYNYVNTSAGISFRDTFPDTDLTINYVNAGTVSIGSIQLKYDAAQSAPDSFLRFDYHNGTSYTTYGLTYNRHTKIIKYGISSHVSAGANGYESWISY